MFACEIPGGSILPTRVIVTRCRLDDWTRFNLFRYAAKQSACPRDGVTLKQTQHTHTHSATHLCVRGRKHLHQHREPRTHRKIAPKNDDYMRGGSFNDHTIEPRSNHLVGHQTKPKIRKTQTEPNSKNRVSRKC